MYLATGVEPTNETAFTSGWCSSASTASLPPWIRFSTPARQAGLVQQFDGARGRERHFFRRLQHEGVAAGDGERVHPHRHHGGEIERRDAGADADGLADGLAVDARAPRRSANRPSSGWACRRPLPPSGWRGALRALASSAVLPFSRVRMRGHLVGVLFQQRLVAVEHLHAVHHRHVAPLQERLVRGAHGAVDIGRGGVGHFRQHGAGGRIGHGAAWCGPSGFSHAPLI